uniref:AAA domain-containing protein n=1 Tax=Macrostomum lignano TaxID=282301 RepID=A0A1I8IQI1_9PLAT
YASSRSISCLERAASATDISQRVADQIDSFLSLIDISCSQEDPKYSQKCHKGWQKGYRISDCSNRRPILMSDLWSGRSCGLPRPDVNAPEREAFRTEDASSSTLEADCFNPGGAAVQCGTDLFRLYMRHKIVDANLSLNHCSYRLSVLEQLAKHKLRYLKQLETVAEKLEDSPSGHPVHPTGGMEIYRVFPDVQDPLVALMLVQKDTESTYEMIGGLERQIREIKEVVELPILHPELFTSLGISQPKGVLLYGPPGTGKTMLARAVAHHTKCAFFKLSGTELVQKYIGEGARLMRELFILARQKAPSIIFLDEVDSIGTKRSDGGGGSHSSGGGSSCERTMIELLNQVDGFEPAENIKVILATNRIDTLDEALIRPGRVDRKIFFPPPNLDGRVDILRIHSRRMNLGARRLECTERRGAELKLICQEAAFSALREGRQFVTQEDFLQRIDKVMKSLSARDEYQHTK